MLGEMVWRSFKLMAGGAMGGHKSWMLSVSCEIIEYSH